MNLGELFAGLRIDFKDDELKRKLGEIQKRFEGIDLITTKVEGNLELKKLQASLEPFSGKEGKNKQSAIAENEKLLEGLEAVQKRAKETDRLFKSLANDFTFSENKKKEADQVKSLLELYKKLAKVNADASVTRRLPTQKSFLGTSDIVSRTQVTPSTANDELSKFIKKNKANLAVSKETLVLQEKFNSILDTTTTLSSYKSAITKHALGVDQRVLNSLHKQVTVRDKSLQIAKKQKIVEDARLAAAKKIKYDNSNIGRFNKKVLETGKYFKITSYAIDKYELSSRRARVEQTSLFKMLRGQNSALDIQNKKAQQVSNTLRDMAGSSILMTGALSGLSSRISAFNGLIGRNNVALGLMIGSLAAAGYAIFKFGSEASRVVQKFDPLIQTLKLVDKSTAFLKDSGDSTFKFLQKVTDKYGLSITGVGGAVAKLGVAFKSIDADQSVFRQTITDTLALSGALHLTTEATEGITKAYEQMLSKGNVYSEELKGQLGDRIPGVAIAALNVFRDTTNNYTATMKDFLDAMKAGKIASDKFVPKLAKEINRLFGVDTNKRINTYIASLQRLQTSYELFILKMDKSTGFTDNLKKSADNLSSVLTYLGQNAETVSSIFTGLISLPLIGVLYKIASAFNKVGLSIDKTTKKMKILNFITKKNIIVLTLSAAAFLLFSNSAKAATDKTDKLIEASDKLLKSFRSTSNTSLNISITQDMIKDLSKAEKEIAQKSKNIVASIQIFKQQILEANTRRKKLIDVGQLFRGKAVQSTINRLNKKIIEYNGLLDISNKKHNNVKQSLKDVSEAYDLFLVSMSAADLDLRRSGNVTDKKIIAYAKLKKQLSETIVSLSNLKNPISLLSEFTTKLEVNISKLRAELQRSGMGVKSYDAALERLHLTKLKLFKSINLRKSEKIFKEAGDRSNAINKNKLKEYELGLKINSSLKVYRDLLINSGQVEGIDEQVASYKLYLDVIQKVGKKQAKINNSLVRANAMVKALELKSGDINDSTLQEHKTRVRINTVIEKYHKLLQKSGLTVDQISSKLKIFTKLSNDDPEKRFKQSDALKERLILLDRAKDKYKAIEGNTLKAFDASEKLKESVRKYKELLVSEGHEEGTDAFKTLVNTYEQIEKFNIDNNIEKVKKLKVLSSELNSSIASHLDGFADSIGQLVVDGDFTFDNLGKSFREMAKSIIKDIIAMTIKAKILKELMNVINGSVSGESGESSGGMNFANAINGFAQAITPSDQPIANSGLTSRVGFPNEGINKNNNDNNGGTRNITVVINANNAKDVMKSQSQITAMIAKASDRGRRNM